MLNLLVSNSELRRPNRWVTRQRYAYSTDQYTRTRTWLSKLYFADKSIEFSTVYTVLCCSGTAVAALACRKLAGPGNLALALGTLSQSACGFNGPNARVLRLNTTRITDAHDSQAEGMKCWQPPEEIYSQLIDGEIRRRNPNEARISSILCV